MEGKEVRYSPRMVAYVDVLGFRNMVRESEQDPSSIRKIWDILQVTRDQVMQMNSVGHRGQHEATPLELQSVMFSDTVVMTQSTSGHSCAGALLDWVDVLQTTLLEHGVFVRGAIAAGGMHVDGNLMFGPAFLKAYDVESLAVWPRVVIDPSVLSVQGAAEWLRHMAARDKDGLLFVDYLKATLVTAISFEVEVALRSGRDAYSHVNAPIACGYFRRHAEQIVESVRRCHWERDAKLIQKFHWLAAYHNQTIGDLCKAAMNDGDSSRRVFESVAWDMGRGHGGLTPTHELVDAEVRRTCELIHGLRIDLIALFPSLYQ
jgi:hypothetical protein